MQLQSLNDFDFSKISKKENKDPDKIVVWGCLLSLIITIFFVIIPENNIEKTGKEMDNFKKILNVEWIKEESIQGNTLEEKTLTTQYLYNQDNLESNLKFLNNVHSILMRDKNNLNKNIWLEKVIKDRRPMIKKLGEEFITAQKTDFECVLFSCKNKEKKVVKEKLQSIKAVNVIMRGYYIDLINLYEKNERKKIKNENNEYTIDSALTNDEMKIYNAMK